MAGINKVILIGNLGQDPDVKHLPSGDSVANVSIATSETWKDKGGNKQEKTEWHRVVFFGKLAEIVGQYLHKGSKVYIEGKLQTREWEKDGIKRYSTEIVVGMGGTMQMLDSRGDSGQSAPRQAPERMDANNRASMDAQKPAMPQRPLQGAEFDDDIPFAPYLKGAEWMA